KIIDARAVRTPVLAKTNPVRTENLDEDYPRFCRDTRESSMKLHELVTCEPVVRQDLAGLMTQLPELHRPGAVARRLYGAWRSLSARTRNPTGVSHEDRPDRGNAPECDEGRPRLSRASIPGLVRASPGVHQAARPSEYVARPPEGV